MTSVYSLRQADLADCLSTYKRWLTLNVMSSVLTVLRSKPLTGSVLEPKTDRKNDS